MSEQSKKILVVEDEKPLAKAMELKLSQVGFEVKKAPDGEVALNFLKKETFDLIILDLIMPKMDGFNLLEELRAQKIHTPVIVTSNLNQKEEFEKARKMGLSNCIDYFVKSDTSLADIVEHVKKALNV